MIGVVVYVALIGVICTVDCALAAMLASIMKKKKIFFMTLFI
jgi:hypothetical protein